MFTSSSLFYFRGSGRALPVSLILYFFLKNGVRWMRLSSFSSYYFQASLMYNRMKNLLLLLLLLHGTGAAAQTIFEVKTGKVRFHSEAPKELISAASDGLTGVLDLTHRNFAFRIAMRSFKGFNSALQREHFNENYMESRIYPVGIFTGKIIEDVDLTRDGEYDVRAKGKFVVHGIEQERIIRCHIKRTKDKISVKSEFDVALADHNIKIPRIVYDKLALVITVIVNANLEQKL